MLDIFIMFINRPDGVAYTLVTWVKAFLMPSTSVYSAMKIHGWHGRWHWHRSSVCWCEMWKRNWKNHLRRSAEYLLLGGNDTLPISVAWRRCAFYRVPSSLLQQTVICARSYLQEVLFSAPSVCVFLFAPIHREDVFGPSPSWVCR